MNKMPEHETNQQARRASERWYQRKWAKRVLVGVLISAIVGMFAFGWTQIETTTAQVMEGVKNGQNAYDLAKSNKQHLQQLGTKIDTLDHELSERNQVILQKLQGLQDSIDRNRTEYERSMEQLRKNLRTIEQHHYTP